MDTVRVLSDDRTQPLLVSWLHDGPLRRSTLQVSVLLRHSLSQRSTFPRNSLLFIVLLASDSISCRRRHLTPELACPLTTDQVNTP
jgi:hypothetical protein